MAFINKKKIDAILVVIFLFFLMSTCTLNAQGRWSVRIDGAGTATVTSNTAFIASADGEPDEITGIGFTSSGTQTVTFDYSFTTGDPGWDNFFYSINGVATFVTNGDPFPPATVLIGSIAVNVPNGSNFFMGINNDDGCCGGA
ncbi:MAG: hypothetical protein ACKO41_01015 [Sphingomonadales bacterium]